MTRRTLLICFLSVALVAQHSWSTESHPRHPTGHALDENTRSTLQLDSGKGWKIDRPRRKGKEHIGYALRTAHQEEMRKLSKNTGELSLALFTEEQVRKLQTSHLYNSGTASCLGSPQQ